MKALTAVAATAYALTLWMFAPESVWRREVEQAKRNQQKSDATLEPELTAEPLIDTPEIAPEPATVPTIEPEPITETEELLLDTESYTEPDTTPEPQQPDYSSLPITQLRELAKQRKLNWRPLINGKRTPLKKPDLIALLTT